MERTATLSPLEANILKRIFNQSPTESRRFGGHSSFKDTNRVRWTELKAYVY